MQQRFTCSKAAYSIATVLLSCAGSSRQAARICVPSRATPSDWASACKRMNAKTSKALQRGGCQGGGGTEHTSSKILSGRLTCAQTVAAGSATGLTVEARLQSPEWEALPIQRASICSTGLRCERLERLTRDLPYRMWPPTCAKYRQCRRRVSIAWAGDASEVRVSQFACSRLCSPAPPLEPSFRVFASVL